jgi:hypothetical protein
MAKTKFYLDLQGSNRTGGDDVHTGLILAAVMVENKRKAPKADKSFLMGHIHYLNIKQFSQHNIITTVLVCEIIRRANNCNF